MNKEQYLQMKQDLNSLHRRQYHKKKQLKEAVKNHSKHRISRFTKELNKGRTKIQDLQQKVIAEQLRLRISGSLNLHLSKQTKVEIRDIVQKIFSIQGLFLHHNNEVSNRNGKLYGHYGNDAKFNAQGMLEFTYKPVAAVDFIIVDLNVDELQVAK